MIKGEDTHYSSFQIEEYIFEKKLFHLIFNILNAMDIVFKGTFPKFYKYLYQISILLIFLSIVACGQDIEKQTAEYSQNYDDLFTYGLSINNFSNATGVSEEILVKMRYGLIKPSKDLTKLMTDLNDDFRKFKRKEALEKVTKKLNENIKVKIETVESKEDYKNLESSYRVEAMMRNEKFDSQLPNYVGSNINAEIEDFIDTKFAWYRFPKNAWDYVFDGKQVLYARYKSGFDKILSSGSVNTIVVRCFNDYSTLLNTEQSILFNRNLNLPILKDVNLDDATSIADSKVLDKSVQRAATDLTDMILLLIEELGVAIIIWIVFSWLSNMITNKYAAWVLDYDMDGGFWKNGFIFGLNLLNSYWESEEREKLARVKRWTQGIITVLFIAASYYWVIRPQMKIENELLSRVETNIKTYVSNMDVPILTYFNSVIDSSLNH